MDDLSSSLMQFMGGDLSPLQPPEAPKAEEPSGGLADSFKQFMGDSLPAIQDFAQQRQHQEQQQEEDNKRFLANPYDAPAQAQPYYVLERERQRAAEEGEKDKTYSDPVTQYVAKAMPFVSSILDTNTKSEYKNARDRFQANAYPDDYQGKMAREADASKIAAYERDQKFAAEFQTKYPLAAAAAQTQGLVSESLIGGAAIRGLAPSVQAGPAIVPQLLKGGTQLAAWSAATPSLYAPKAAERAIEQGGDWTSAKNLWPAFVEGMIQNAIMGKSAEHASGLVGQLGNPLARRAASGLVGAAAFPAEQQAADVATSVLDNFLPDSLKFNTGYGLLGKWARGEGIKKDLAMEMLTGAFFGAVHDPGVAKRNLEIQTEALNDLAKRGLPADVAAKRLVDVKAQLDTAAQAAPDSPAAVQQAIEKLPENSPERKFAEAVGDTIIHIADYKNPGNSADTAIAMLERKGKPVDVWVWDSPEAKQAAEAQMAKNTVAFQIDRQTFSG